jgi:hypothetical protein
MPTRKKQTAAHIRLARRYLEDLHSNYGVNGGDHTELAAIAACLGAIVEDVHTIATRMTAPTTPTDPTD